MTLTRPILRTPPYPEDYDSSNHPTRYNDWSASCGTTRVDRRQGAELCDGFISAVADIAENAAWHPDVPRCCARRAKPRAVLRFRIADHGGEANGRRVFAMEVSPACIDVAVERRQADTGREAILDGDGRTFATVKVERPEETPAAPETQLVRQLGAKLTRHRASEIPSVRLHMPLEARVSTRRSSSVRMRLLVLRRPTCALTG